jgi:tRNA A37 methylthiotransferase MiaB
MSRIRLKSYGCSANTADAEIVRGILISNGHTLVENSDDADINVILTCVVKTPTEQKISRELRKLETSGKPLIVAGCMPKSMTNQVEKLVPRASLVGPDDIEHIPEAVQRIINGERVIYINGEATDRTCLPRVRENPLIHIAPISTGCLGNCSYCIVKFARGSLYSFPARKIVQDVRTALTSGCCEVWITAEGTATYNYEGIRLPELLNMISSIKRDFRVRVGMATPNQLKPMRRRYTVQEFKDVANRLREVYPQIGISTDIICGFPGETFEQFQDSLKLIEWLRPDVLNINRFWERPGTEAGVIPGRLHGRDTKERSRIMTRLWKKIAVEVGKCWIDWEGDILLTEHGRSGTKVGRNYAYKAVALKTDASLGSFVKVKIKKSGVGYLTAIEI